MDVTSVKTFFETRFFSTKSFLNTRLWEPLTNEQKIVVKVVSAIFSLLVIAYTANRLWTRKCTKIDQSTQTDAEVDTKLSQNDSLPSVINVSALNENNQSVREIQLETNGNHDVNRKEEIDKNRASVDLNKETEEDDNVSDEGEGDLFKTPIKKRFQTDEDNDNNHSGLKTSGGASSSKKETTPQSTLRLNIPSSTKSKLDSSQSATKSANLFKQLVGDNIEFSAFRSAFSSGKKQTNFSSSKITPLKMPDLSPIQSKSPEPIKQDENLLCTTQKQNEVHLDKGNASGGKSFQVGYGTYANDEKIYEGDFVDFCLEGIGRVTNRKTQLVLEGEFKKGRMVKCTSIILNSDIYKKHTTFGQIFQGEIISEDKPVIEDSSTFTCKYTTKDGQEWVGKIENGKFNGRGKATWDGTLESNFYITAYGTFIDNFFCDDNGLKIFLKNDELYKTCTGNFVKNKLEGQGDVIFANGNQFSGEFKKGKLEGNGIKTILNSKGETTQIEGNFVAGKLNGIGKKTFPSGRFQEGYFENGKFVKSLKLKPDPLKIDPIAEESESDLSI
ncbi:MAG: hypothetical protein H0W88_02750 [Parachlamydiaceae bacterium]|nr:hypothetical protein [Parachlamydiaceae bacterium]